MRIKLLYILVVAAAIVAGFLIVYVKWPSPRLGSESYIQLDGGAIFLETVPSPDSLAYSYKVLVIGGDGLSKDDIGFLKTRNSLVLGYINVGKLYSERFREYVESVGIVHNVEGLGEVVEFWRSEWRTIIISELDRIYGLGYDGVLLDDVDIYKLLENDRPEWCGDRDLRLSMEELIVGLIRYCRENLNASFGIYLGFSYDLEMLDMDIIYDSVDGVFFRGLWHVLSEGEVIKICECEVGHIFAKLDEAVADGKLVVIVDPVEDEADAREFSSVARLRGYIPVPQPVEYWDFSRPPPPNYYENL